VIDLNDEMQMCIQDIEHAALQWLFASNSKLKASKVKSAAMGLGAVMILAFILL
jgi:hypothetical protein